ncbi:MAG TPA: hypothetical protein VN917_06795 [Xanthobacteraceae bacterium]|nr:hypothetical protein [Xanthobacteraceae bacterium]
MNGCALGEKATAEGLAAFVGSGEQQQVELQRSDISAGEIEPAPHFQAGGDIGAARRAPADKAREERRGEYRGSQREVHWLQRSAEA